MSWRHPKASGPWKILHLNFRSDSCWTSLYLPRPVLDAGQAEERGDLAGLLGAGQVLLVGEDHERHSGELIVSGWDFR